MGSSSVIGIDISSHSIKAVVLKPVGELYALIGYKELPISDDIFSDNHTFEYQKIVKKLKELKKELPLFSKKVAISIPDNSVISKVLQIESELEDREKEFSIYQTFAHQSPFPIEDLSLDFVKVEEKRFGKSSTTSYQVYATRKEVVESRSLAIKKAGLEPVVVDIHAHGLLNIWQLASRLNPDKRNWLLVDVGLNQLSLGTMPQGSPSFYKDISFGSHSTNSIAESHPTSAFGSAEENQKYINDFIDKLKRQLQLYSSVNPAHPLSGIWLMGESANTPMLIEELERQLGLSCELLNPLSLFENKLSKKRRMHTDWQSYGIAAGMAISGLKWGEVKHVASS